MVPCKGKSLKTISTERQRQQAEVDEIMEELDTVYDIECRNDITGLSIRSLLGSVVSYEYTLQEYINVASYIDDETLSHCVDVWYENMMCLRIYNEDDPVEDKIKLLREHYNGTITMPQIRFLLLKEASLPEDIKRMYYNDSNDIEPDDVIKGADLLLQALNKEK